MYLVGVAGRTPMSLNMLYVSWYNGRHLKINNTHRYREGGHRQSRGGGVRLVCISISLRYVAQLDGKR